VQRNNTRCMPFPLVLVKIRDRLSLVVWIVAFGLKRLNMRVV
jgi:hypothetical protein